MRFKSDFVGLSLVGLLTMGTVFWQAWWLIIGGHGEPPATAGPIWLFLTFALAAPPWILSAAAAILAGARRSYGLFAALFACLIIGLTITTMLTLDTRPTGLDRGSETRWAVTAWLLMTWIGVGPVSLGALGAALATRRDRNTPRSQPR